MGRNRGKGKKQTTIATREDIGSGEEEKIPAKRRGRPLKTVKNEILEKKEAEKLDDGENSTGILSDKNINTQVVMESGTKRRRASEIEENNETVKEKNGVDLKIEANDSVKPVGFRQNGSRRKNKPQRAAEVGVECR